MFLITVSPADTLQCFVPGECENSALLSQSITLGENACLHFCQKVEGCEWFTYHPENSLCIALSGCFQKNYTTTAILGQQNCPDLNTQCWTHGLCKGILITEVKHNSFHTLVYFKLCLCLIILEICPRAVGSIVMKIAKQTVTALWLPQGLYIIITAQFLSAYGIRKV